jgi:DNA mismatch repair protein MutS2
MNPKTLVKLELDKILERLSAYAAFSASAALLSNLEPTSDLEVARRRLQETTEARDLLEEQSGVTIGGARDVRPYARNAERGLTLSPEQLLEIKATLQSAGTLKRIITRSGERFPLLSEIALGLDEGKAIVTAINQVISDQGEVLDSASPRLMQIRNSLRVAHDRLHTKLQSLITSSQNAPYLQEALITVRNGRYVIPVKAEHRGRIKGIVHDQSSSGATLFIEPLSTVEINNQIKELELAEQEEIHRILSEITALIGSQADRIVWTVEALATLDAAFAKAKYACELRASPPGLIDFDPHRTPGSTIRLYGARHPLLDPHTVVPIDLEMSGDTYILIITGPNTGGKTVSLKTVGLMALMAQCGLHIPADPGSTLTVFDSIYADIGDEQSIEQSLSTFSAHLTHINEILQHANERSLVLLDELGSGTDPTEGAAIARAILNELLRRRVTTLVATHYPELKLYAHSTPGVRNASVEFDVETLSPTYRLIVGLPGRSNALAIAERLGLPHAIIQEARSYVGEADLTADNLLDEIHRTREEIRQTQSRLAAAEVETQRLRAELRTRLEQIEEERQRVVGEARQQAQSELEALREEIREVRRQLRSFSPPRDAQQLAPTDTLKRIEEEVKLLEEIASEPVKRAATAPVPSTAGETPASLQPGDRVFVPALKTEGEIVSLGDGQAEVQIGQFRMKVDPDTLERRAGRRRESRVAPRYEGALIKTPRPESPGLELHLRGLTAEDAIPILEEYLDRAYLSGLPWVRVVHGKGSGILRKVVQDTLRGHPLVKSFSRAADNEGGDGATVVYFVPLG